MNTSISERLSRLRKAMQEQAIDLCIIPTADYHQSEYVADFFKYRAYLSGFSGSAGTLVVSLREAKLWTDSRYFLQAEQQLCGNGIDLMKMNHSDYPDMYTWIKMTQATQIGIDAEVFSVQEVKQLQACQEAHHGQLNINFKSYEQVWTNRPFLPKAPAYLLNESVCGQSTDKKLQAIRAKMQAIDCNTYLLCALDEIAWTFNLRGQDIAYNPVALCYAMIGMNEARLYIDASKINAADGAQLSKHGISLQPYENFAKDIQKFDIYNKVCFDAAKINYLVYDSIPEICQSIDTKSLIAPMKAVKNQVELAGMDRAMIKDGICFVRWWKRLEETLAQGKKPGEYELAQDLAEERLQQVSCVGESFEAIVAYGENGAIVHYTANKENQAQVAYGNILLIDQGGQYSQDGTTDMTRTLALYEHKEDIPAEYFQDYAAVLKGNIALAQAHFPAGSRGCQLDALARQFLWKQACHYGHGTGHGVGHFLNVHEGPQSIRVEENPVKLEEGMILSNEPGVYKAGRYGIRLENLLAVEKADESEFGSFLRFRTLTLCPWDLKSIDKQYYSAEEIVYLNSYHAKVYESLAPHLNEEEKLWLQEKTKAL